MRRIVIVGVWFSLTVYLSSILFAQPPSASEGDEQRIIALENI